MSDLNRKVRFQTSEKKDRNTDFCDNTDNVMIYDNYQAEGSPTPPKLQDDATKDQQQITPVNESSRERNLLRAAAVCLGQLCLLLLTAVIVVLVLSSQDKSNWIMGRNQLWADNANLTSERDELQSSYSDVKSHNHNLTQKTSQLENENDHLQAVNNNLTKERDELQNHIDNKTLDFEASFKTLTEQRDELKKKLTDFVHYSQQEWKYFSGSFYYISSNKKTWNESRTDCLRRGADLVVVNSEEEQEFINQYRESMWIGLTHSEREGTWKWVDGTPVTTSFWRPGEPNNHKNNEDCVEAMFYRNEHGWNDVICRGKKLWICEKKMFL